MSRFGGTTAQPIESGRSPSSFAVPYSWNGPSYGGGE